jgi:putative transposase
MGRLCRLLGITRQCFYQSVWRRDDLSVQDELIVQQVHVLRALHRSMGTRKLYVLLQPFLMEHQIKIGRDALFDLLSAHRLLVRKRRRRIATTQSWHTFHKYPNLTSGIHLTGINQLWVSDITYQKVADNSWSYISFVSDAYSHKILGYQVAPTLETVYCKAALQMAINSLADHKSDGLIHHSDRGLQYCSQQYVQLLQQNDIAISMTQTGDPRENAIAERVNGIIKEEYLNHHQFKTQKEVEEKLQQAVNLYNNERPHMSCSMLSPTTVHEHNLPVNRAWKSYYQKRQAVER